MRKKFLIVYFFIITLCFSIGCKNNKEYQVLSVTTSNYSSSNFSDYDMTLKSFEIKKDIELNKTITLFGNTVDLEYYFSGFNSKLIPLDTYNVKYINGVPCKDESRYICFTPDGNITNIVCASVFSFAVNISATKEDRAAALLMHLDDAFDIDPSYNKIRETIKDDELIISIGNDDSELTERDLGIVCNKYNGRVLQVAYDPPISENLTKEKILSKKDVFPSVKKKVLEMESDIALKSMEIKNMYVVEYNGKLYYYCNVYAEITRNETGYTNPKVFNFLIPV